MPRLAAALAVLAGLVNLVSAAAMGVAGAHALRPRRRPEPIPVRLAASGLAGRVLRVPAHRTGPEEAA